MESLSALKIKQRRNKDSSRDISASGASQKDWERMARGWEKWYSKFSKQSIGATNAILELSQIKQDMNILDLACGSGEPSLSIATHVGPKGHVVATDIVPEMLQIAEKNAREKGLSNIEFKVSNAETLDFPDESFDAVTCRFGVMFFSDPQKAMSEINRVLKKDRLVSLVSWGPEAKNPRFTATTAILRKYLNAVGSNSASQSVLQYSEHGSLAAILKGAFFREINEEYRDIPWIWDGTPREQFRSFREISGPFSKLFDALDKERKRKATQEILSAITKFYDGQSVNFTAVINCAAARK